MNIDKEFNLLQNDLEKMRLEKNSLLQEEKKFQVKMKQMSEQLHEATEAKRICTQEMEDLNKEKEETKVQIKGYVEKINFYRDMLDKYVDKDKRMLELVTSLKTRYKSSLKFFNGLKEFLEDALNCETKNKMAHCIKKVFKKLTKQEPHFDDITENIFAAKRLLENFFVGLMDNKDMISNYNLNRIMEINQTIQQEVCALTLIEPR